MIYLHHISSLNVVGSSCLACAVTFSEVVTERLCLQYRTINRWNLEYICAGCMLLFAQVNIFNLIPLKLAEQPSRFKVWQVHFRMSRGGTCLFLKDLAWFCILECCYQEVFRNVVLIMVLLLEVNIAQNPYFLYDINFISLQKCIFGIKNALQTCAFLLVFAQDDISCIT